MNLPRIQPLLAAGLLAIAGCAAWQEPEERGEIYRHNWWNYYARGQAFLRQGRVAQAEADFQSCLGERDGARFANGRDAWRARTYGLHFIDGYFPNRELGICLYERGDFSNAARRLERSLQLEPSGRAKHYLNLAHRAALNGRTVPPPVVRLTDDAAARIVATRACTLAGSVEAAGRVARLSIAGHADYIELASPACAFTRRLDLAPGTNVVAIAAQDLLGQQTERRVTLIADWQPPRLALRRVSSQGRDWRVEATCRDDYGVAAITLDGAALYRSPAPDRGERVVQTSFRVPWPGARLVLTDLAGNRLDCLLDAAALAAAVPPAAVGRPLAAADRAIAAALGAPAAPSTDRLPPALDLRGIRDRSTVFETDFFLDGRASDGGGLRSVAVNGEELLAPEDRGAVRSCFVRRVPLQLGTNALDVTAEDLAGNRTVRPLVVVRLQPEYLDAALRLTVGVPPLLPEKAGTGIRAKRGMEMELARDPVRFRLLERDEGWDYVLREQGLAVSDLADPRAALRIGKLLPAELLFMGRVIDEARGITLYVKAVDTASGEVRFATDVYSPDPDTRLDDAAAGLVMKIKQGFPLVSGAVLQRHGAMATLNIGLRDGVTPGSRFVVLPGASSDGTGGTVRRADGRPVQLAMEQVRRDSATARIIPPEAGNAVEEGDHVYAR